MGETLGPDGNLSERVSYDGPPRVPVRYPRYTVEWSEEDQGFVATCDWFPSMSLVDRDCVEALSRFADLLLQHFGEEGLVRQRDYLNGVRRVEGPYR
jgi:hypothetical protein